MSGEDVPLMKEEGQEEEEKPSTVKAEEADDLPLKDSSEEEESDEEDGYREDGFVVADESDEDLPDIEDDDEKSSEEKRGVRRLRKGGKRRQRDLDQEDLDLIHYSMGTLPASKLRKTTSDSEGASGLDPISFAKSSSTRVASRKDRGESTDNIMDDLEEDPEANSDDDDFLVDDSEDENEDAATRKARKKERRQRQNLAINFEQYEDAAAIYNDEWLEDLYDPTGEDIFDDSEFAAGGPVREAGDSMAALKKQYEPETLKAMYMTEKDEQIRLTDLPERYQLAYATRDVPGEEELKMEAEWIADKLIALSGTLMDSSSVTEKVTDVLTFLLSSHFEVSFIEHYRKEFWAPVLTPKDLWLIHDLDHQWYVLQARKNALRKAMPDEDTIAGDLRLADIRRRLDFAQTEESVQDLVEYFHFHYSQPTTAHQANNIASAAPLEDVVEDDNQPEKPQIPKKPLHKQPIRSDTRTLAKENALDKFWIHLGIKPAELALALTNPDAIKLEKTFPLQTPLELAEPLISTKFSSAHAVLTGTRTLYAAELSTHPLFRARVTEHFSLRGVVSTKATPNGKLYIDLHHPFANVRHLQRKPISSFQRSALFLQILKAVEGGLLEVSIGLTKEDVEMLINEIGAVFQMESPESLSMDPESPSYLWAKLRRQIITEAIAMVMPKLIARTKAKLHKEATQVILSEAEQNVEQMLRAGPIPIPTTAVRVKRSHGKKGRHKLEEEVDVTPPIVAICVGDPLASKEVMAMVAVIDEHGEVLETLSILATLRVEDSIAMRELFRKHMPFAVAVGIDTPVAKKFMGTMTELSSAFVAEERLTTTIQVVPMPLDVANIFQSTKHAEKEINSSSFSLPTSESATLLRRCISIARRLLNPLFEIAGLATQEDHVLGLDLHPLQKLVNPHALRRHVDNAFVRVVSDIGVDMNRIMKHTWMQPIVQFVPGLGPRKASSLLQGLLRADVPLESRNQLKDSAEASSLRPNEYLGPVVWYNAIAFLNVRGTDQLYIRDWNPLDGTRIHPTVYPLAKKIADDLAASGHVVKDENDEFASLSALFADPTLLRYVDLNAMVEGMRSRNVEKELTMRALVEEIKAPFADPRVYSETSSSVLFDMMVGKGAMDEGSVVTVRTVSRDGSSGSWEVALPHGVMGTISGGDFPENQTEVRRDQMIQAQIITVDKELFRCTLTCIISSTKWDANSVVNKDAWLVPESALEMSDADLAALANLTSSAVSKPSILKRQYVHKHFENKSIAEVKEALQEKPVLSFMIHPTSKAGRLNLTFKFYFDTYAHITMDEITEGEEKGALRVENEKFEDLDDLVLNFVTPLLDNIRELEKHACFLVLNKADMIAHIQKEKRDNPQRSPYHIAPSQEKPGHFLLYYIPGTQTVQKEWVRVVPDGYRYRSQTHKSLNRLLAYFKKHHNDPRYWDSLLQQQQPLHLQQQHPAAYETMEGGRFASMGADYYTSGAYGGSY